MIYRNTSFIYHITLHTVFQWLYVSPSLDITISCMALTLEANLYKRIILVVWNINLILVSFDVLLS